MDQVTDMKRESKQPKYQQNNKDSPEHRDFLSVEVSNFFRAALQRCAYRMKTFKSKCFPPIFSNSHKIDQHRLLILLFVAEPTPAGRSFNTNADAFVLTLEKKLAGRPS